jgi:cysteinyl-tRNA synthetase
MTLKLYNSATRKKEILKPIKNDHVGIYVCGVTVYDLCHIGHARSAIVFDMFIRYLRARGMRVTYVRNFTDVDDKIIERAKEMAEETTALANRYIKSFYEDMHSLGVLDADIEPRATEHINDMITMIKILVEKGFAYAIDSMVYFSVEKFKTYGALSGRKLEDMIAGARIDVDENKKHPMDFVLWKGAKPGEPQWESPWGKGRPGWHIECSAMSCKYLGNNFDIHGGGRDLIFPHHENERAQAMAANGVNYANYWMHNGFLTVESEKMSKSLGNFITIRDAIRLYHPQVLRLFLLSKHYRSPLDFSKASLSEAKSGLIKIYRTLQRLDEELGPYDARDTITIPAFKEAINGKDFKSNFFGAMDDDLNTAAGLGLIFDKVKGINRLLDKSPNSNKIKAKLSKERNDLLSCANILGLLEETPAKFLENILRGDSDIKKDEVEKLIRERNEARRMKDWAAADSIRDNLSDMGITLEDKPDGTAWRFKTNDA